MNYFKMLLQFKDIRADYLEAKKENKPWWASRTLIGAILTLIGMILASRGIILDQASISSIADNITTIIPALVGLYGLALHIVGIVNKSVVIPGGPEGQVAVATKSDYNDKSTPTTVKIIDLKKEDAPIVKKVMSQEEIDEWEARKAQNL